MNESIIHFATRGFVNPNWLRLKVPHNVGRTHSNRFATIQSWRDLRFLTQSVYDATIYDRKLQKYDLITNWMIKQITYVHGPVPRNGQNTK